MSANSRERLQQAIDAEIQQSLEATNSESVRELKLRHNALSPISSLPPEVFAVIFFLLSFARDGVIITHRDKHMRFYLSHVCHQWREMALNQPLLWSEVDFSYLSLACTSEILARAKMVPLDLRSRVPDRHSWNKVRFRAFQKQLQAHVPYAYQLSIDAELVRLRKILEGLVSPAPTLGHLSLISRGGYWNAETGGWDVFIPDTLFDGFAPRLFHLFLFRFTISWKSPLLKGLRHLEIHRPGRRPKLVDWLDGLNELSQLETLILLSASPIASQDGVEHHDNATLPSLTYLEIYASPAECALALGHLDLPALTALAIAVVPQPSDSISDLQTLLPHLSRHAYGPQDTQPLQSMLLRSEMNSAIIYAWSVTDIDVLVQESSYSTYSATNFTPRMALSFKSIDRYAGDGDTRRDILDVVLLGLPLSSLDTFLVQEFKVPPDRSFWLRHAPKWPLIRRVQLEVPAHDAFKMILLDGNNRERPQLPLLTELVLIGSTDDWIPALKKRTEQGVPLERLDLRMCYSREDVPLLREIVADVCWEDSTPGLSMLTERRWYNLITTTFSQDDILEVQYNIYTDGSENDEDDE
jgi:hypothetical protein